MSIYRSAVKKPVTTALIFVAFAVFGVFSLMNTSLANFPDFDANVVLVMSSYPGASASDIENNLTKVLENTLNGVADLKDITSSSKENVSIVVLEFEYGTDIDEACNNIRDKLDLVNSSLPDGASVPVLFKFGMDDMPVLILSAKADKSLMGLDKILDDKLVTPLGRVKGVGTISVSGAPAREIHVYCDPNKLEAYGLSVSGISQIIAAENRNVPSGSIDIGAESFTLRVEKEFKDPSELMDIVVSTRNGQTVYLRDVATVIDGLEEKSQESFTNGERSAMIAIQKQSGANTVNVIRSVKQKLKTIEPTLPSDVRITTVVDSSTNILNTLNSLKETIFITLLVVMLVVYIFLGRWRATFIIVLSIPIALLGSLIYLYATGNTLNIISMSALSIAIGMVVDDAIVVLENVTTHIERGSDPKQASVHGTNEVAISVIASTLTMIAVFFPLTMVTGMSGVLFKQLGWMMCAIMFVSTVAALTLTPMLCSQLLRLQRKQSKVFRIFFGPIERTLDGLDNWYARMLNWAVRHRMSVLLGCVVFFILSLFCAKSIGTEFFPAQDNARIAVQLELPIGTRKEVAQEVSEKLTNQWLQKYKGVMKICNYTVGQADSDNTWASMQDNGSHIISFNISLVDPGDRDVTLEAVCDEMREDLKAYPEFSKAQVILGGSNTGMSAQASADFEVYGYSMEETDSVAARLKRELLNVKGVSEVNISRSDYQPEYQVDFDREKLALHGLNLSTAATYLRNRINGATASKYREDGDEYDIKVRYAPEFRTSLESIENILVYNAKGEGIRIKDLGTVVERFAPPTIERKDRERIVTVSAVISGAPLGDVVAAGNTIIDKIEKPSDITIQISGSYEDQQDSFRDLGTLGVLIIILVFIVMAAQFESLTYPFILILSVPFAMSGVLMALFITNTTLSVMSLLGSIMLIGIVVKNGIVLIDYTILCRERGQSVLNAVVTAGKSRLRPVLMTTMTTILGMIPMAVSTGQGSEMWSPMAIAVIGGLTISTILTLIYVPTMYCIFGGVGIKRQRRKMQKQLNAYFEEQKQTNN